MWYVNNKGDRDNWNHIKITQKTSEQSIVKV